MNLPGNQLAIGIYSLDRLDPELFKRVLAPRLDPQRVVEVTLGTQVVRAIPFKDDISLLTAAMAVDILRSENRKAGQPEIDVYRLRQPEWRPIAADEVLTVQVKEKFILNQRIFGTMTPEHLVPLEAPRPAILKGKLLT